MPLRNTPIRKKLMIIILMTSGAVLLLTCVASTLYEFLAFRKAARQHLSTLGEIIAANSTAALAFDNQDDAAEILGALRAEPHIVAAGLFDKDGKVFARYPRSAPDEALPAAPGATGYRFENFHLAGFQPVLQGNRRLGTLYLQSDMGALYDGLKIYGAFGVLVVAGSLLLAYLLSGLLQKQISRPILALTETARAVSGRRDYSVRAEKQAEDEVGLLTDAFNQMLGQIQEQTQEISHQNQSLSESEVRVRAVLNSAISAVVVIDAGGKIIDWNARAEALFGWTRQEALGRELAETIVPPRYRAAHRHGLEHFVATGEGQVLGRIVELDALRRDGAEFPVELCISPLKAGGVVTFCGFITDITERKMSEQKIHAQLSRLDLLSRTTRAIAERQDLPSIFHVVLRSLENDLPIDFGCVCIYDAAQETLTVAGVGQRSRPLARELAMQEDSHIPIDQDGLSRCLQGRLVYEPDVRGINFPFPQRLAQGGLGSVVIAPLLVESSVFGVLVAARQAVDGFSSADCEFLRQLSEHTALAAHQAQLHNALQQAYEDLRQTQQIVMQQERLRALGQMASGIAHDINNAISPVALYTESLLESEPNLSARARGYLQTIARAIDDVAATVARMREFYRQRETQLTLAPVNLNELAGQVVDLTRARWSDMAQQRGTGIELVTELAPGLPAIMGVESEIREALTNLVFNAVDALPEGGRITIRTRATESAPDPELSAPARRVQVEVADTGVGMDEDTRRRCLEPFFTTKGERGTGLGLAMVYGMVQRHSADIEIESTVGQGTTIRLGFAIATTVGQPGAPAVSRAMPPRMRILVVDDDPMLLKSLRDTLEMDGHLVVAANNGQTGIETFRAACAGPEPFHVVITDLGMPRVDGRKVAAAVKDASPATPVILLTGWGHRLAAEGDIPPHVDHLLSKPPKLHELRDALFRCCQTATPQPKPG